MPQLTEEDLKNMTPEQIKELQKQQCIFCQIISGRVQSKKIYEDDKVIAILDINPANPGHVLLLPKEHYSIMPQMNDEEISYMFNITKGISHALLRALQVEGTNIFIANGVAAGQKAPHFMIHIIPRKQDDQVLGLTIPEKTISVAELDKIYAAIKNKINASFGLAAEDFGEKKTAVEEEEEEETPAAKTVPKQQIVEAEFEEEKAIEEETGAPKKKGFDINKIAALFTGKKQAVQERPEPEEERTPEEEPLEEEHAQEPEEESLKPEPKTQHNIPFHHLAAMFQKKSPEQKQDVPALSQGHIVQKQPIESDFFVSSKKSSKFHVTNCPFALNVSKANKQIFKTREDAIDAGKEPCECVTE